MVLCCWGVQACRLPAVKCLKSPAVASTRRSGHKHLLLEPWSLLFASMALCCWGVQACRLPAVKCLKSPAAASTKHSGHKHFLLEPWSLPFASMALSCYSVQACRLPAVKCLKCLAAASTSYSCHKHVLLEPWSLPFTSMALWLPFASRQMPKIPCGSFHQICWWSLEACRLPPWPSVVTAFKPAVCQPSNA